MMFQRLAALLVLALAPLLLTGRAHAIDIQEVTSPGGIKAWLVEAHGIPLISMQMAFDGGAALDPPGKEGAVNFLTGMMDEGAGDLDGPAFQKLRDSHSISLSFSASSDYYQASLSTLSKNKDEALGLLKRAVTDLHLTEEPMERMRAYFIQRAEDAAKDPTTLAVRNWASLAFPGTAYARLTDGTPESLKSITADDLRALSKAVFTRHNLRIAVAGDIDAATLGHDLDALFGGLPAGEERSKPAITMTAGPLQKVIAYEAPQSVLLFGGPAPDKLAADSLAYYVATQLLGGDATFARLTRDVREKRGLTYGVSFDGVDLKNVHYGLGYLSTANATAGEALAAAQETMARFAAEGPSDEELALAKTNLMGAYVLRFDSNASIASALLGMQMNGFPIDYIKTRNSRVSAVSRDEVKAAARHWLDPAKMVTVIVGKPEGLKP
ncbi:MAG: pitrilysin family protein [Hyphomicrobiales bacterium]